MKILDAAFGRKTWIKQRWTGVYYKPVLFALLISIVLIISLKLSASNNSIKYCPYAGLQPSDEVHRSRKLMNLEDHDDAVSNQDGVSYYYDNSKRKLKKTNGEVFGSVNNSISEPVFSSNSEKTFGRSANDGKWFTVHTPFDIYIYSAFYDDRESLESSPVIRVIAISIADNVASNKLYCHIQYSLNTNAPAYISPASKQEIGAGMVIQGQRFTEYIFTCPTVVLHSCGKPKRMAFSGKVLNSPVWIDVEEPLVSHDPGLVAVCVSVAYSELAPSARQLIEWVELQKILGVDKVVLYNHSAPIFYEKIITSYSSFVELRQSHSFMSEERLMGVGVGYQSQSSAILLHMSPVINDCMYRLSRSYEFISVIDLDEIIIPRHHRTIPELLEHLSHSIGGATSRLGSLVFSNAYFFLDIPDDTMNGQVKQDSSKDSHSSSIYLTHRRRLPPSELNYAVKSIVHSSACYAMHNHFCWAYTKRAFRRWQLDINVSPSIALLHHYKNCHMDSYSKVDGKCAEMFKTAVYDNIMSKYRTELLLGIERKRQEINV